MILRHHRNPGAPGPRELIARVRALLRRRPRTQALIVRRFSAGALTVDLEGREVVDQQCERVVLTATGVNLISTVKNGGYLLTTHVTPAR